MPRSSLAPKQRCLRHLRGIVLRHLSPPTTSAVLQLPHLYYELIAPEVGADGSVAQSSWASALQAQPRRGARSVNNFL